MKAKILNARLAFPQLFEPKQVNGEGDPRYSATGILDPAATRLEFEGKVYPIKSLNKVIEKVAAERWKDKAGAVLAQLHKKGRVCFVEGPKCHSKTGEPFNGFEDMYHISTSNKVRPLVLDADKTPLTAADGRLYGGCYVNLLVDLWPQDNQWGQRINATLLGVQFLRDGDAFVGGTPATQDDFDDLTQGADAEELV